MTHVAEVDDPGDVAVVVGEGVVGREVGVDDLGAQGRPDGHDGRVEPIEHRFDERPMLRIPDRAEQLPAPPGVLDVPEHRPLGSRVEETAQCPIETGRHRRPSPRARCRTGSIASIRPRPGRME